MEENSPQKLHVFAKTLSVFGEILLTLAVVAGLFVVYDLWWTNVESAQATATARKEAREYINKKPRITGTPKLGQAFALMYIPRLRSDVWELPVIQGVDKTDLSRGVGHYRGSAMPGESGNFAVAGHRATNGQPFANFDKLRSGDKVFVETTTSWFVYQLKADRIVQPTERWVIGNSPSPTQNWNNSQLITLTTCNPRWASYERWAFWGKLVKLYPRESGPPAEMGRV